MEIDKIDFDNVDVNISEIKQKGETAKRFFFPEETIRGILVQYLDALGKMEGCEGPLLDATLISNKSSYYNGGVELIFGWDKPEPKETTWNIFQTLNDWATLLINHKKVNNKKWYRFARYIADKNQVVVTQHVTKKCVIGNAEGEKHTYPIEEEITIPIKSIVKIKKQCELCRGTGTVFALRQSYNCKCGNGYVEYRPDEFYKKVKAKIL